MFNSTIMLLLGGFTLAAGLSKHGIDKLLATRVLALAGTRPSTFLLTQMLVACFASMWISNVAAPILCFGLVKPILRTLPTQSPYGKALVLGIALASNMSVASPPKRAHLRSGGQASRAAWSAHSETDTRSHRLAAEPHRARVHGHARLVAAVVRHCPARLLQLGRAHLRPALPLLFVGQVDAHQPSPADQGSLQRDPDLGFVRVPRHDRAMALCAVARTVAGALTGCRTQLTAQGDMGVIALVPIVLLYGTGMLAKVRLSCIAAV